MFATQTKTLRHRLWGERNGVVADTMRRMGLSYPENWGVGLPTIRKIARETRTALLGGTDDASFAHEDIRCGVEPTCGGVGETPGKTFVHAWARELWLSPLRELRLAALWLADPISMVAEADFWERSLDTPELADEFAFALRTRKI